MGSIRVRLGETVRPGTFMAMERASTSKPTLFFSQAKPMPIEFLHATLGIAFTCIWLAIGQIIVGGK